MSYSQNNEEQEILLYLDGRPNRSMMLLDIGAYDGEAKSNTLALVERGWGGVLVEPNPFVFLRLLNLHGLRENLDLVHALIGTENSTLKFWMTADAVSTTDRAHFEHWKKQVHFEPPFYMPQISVTYLLHLFPRLADVDVISLDIEATNFAVFKELLKYTRPRVFCVEKDSPKLRAEMSHIADCYGYKVLYESGENMVFTHD